MSHVRKRTASSTGDPSEDTTDVGLARKRSDKGVAGNSAVLVLPTTPSNVSNKSEARIPRKTRDKNDMNKNSRRIPRKGAAVGVLHNPMTPRTPRRLSQRIEVPTPKAQRFPAIPQQQAPPTTRGRAASSEPPTTIPRRRRKNKRDDWMDKGSRTPKATRSVYQRTPSIPAPPNSPRSPPVTPPPRSPPDTPPPRSPPDTPTVRPLPRRLPDDKDSPRQAPLKSGLPDDKHKKMGHRRSEPLYPRHHLSAQRVVSLPVPNDFKDYVFSTPRREAQIAAMVRSQSSLLRRLKQLEDLSTNTTSTPRNEDREPYLQLCRGRGEHVRQQSEPGLSTSPKARRQVVRDKARHAHRFVRTPSSKGTTSSRATSLRSLRQSTIDPDDKPASTGPPTVFPGLLPGRSTPPPALPTRPSLPGHSAPPPAFPGCAAHSASGCRIPLRTPNSALFPDFSSIHDDDPDPAYPIVAWCSTPIGLKRCAVQPEDSGSGLSSSSRPSMRVQILRNKHGSDVSSSEGECSGTWSEDTMKGFIPHLDDKPDTPKPELPPSPLGPVTTTTESRLQDTPNSVAEILDPRNAVRSTWPNATPTSWEAKLSDGKDSAPATPIPHSEHPSLAGDLTPKPFLDTGQTPTKEEPAPSPLINRSLAWISDKNDPELTPKTPASPSTFIYWMKEQSEAEKRQHMGRTWNVTQNRYLDGDEYPAAVDVSLSHTPSPKTASAAPTDPLKPATATRMMAAPSSSSTASRAAAAERATTLRPPNARRTDVPPHGLAKDGNYPCLQCNLNFDTRDKWWTHVSKARCGFIYGKLRCYVCGVQNDPFISHAPRYYYKVPGGQERYVCDRCKHGTSMGIKATEVSEVANVHMRKGDRVSSTTTGKYGFVVGFDADNDPRVMWDHGKQTVERRKHIRVEQQTPPVRGRSRSRSTGEDKRVDAQGNDIPVGVHATIKQTLRSNENLERKVTELEAMLNEYKARRCCCQSCTVM